MREIKFRVWNQDRQEFQYMIFTNGGHWSHSIEAYSTNALRAWQQFTGLHDKNGVEIYEGDIVEMTHWNPSRWIVDYSDDNGAFYFRHKVEQPYDTCHPMRYLERATVIGNIHENPELLEQK